MRALGFFVVVVVSLPACVGDSTSGDGGRQMGDEGGPCFPNFSCTGGLVCDRNANLCQQPDGSSGDGGTTDGGNNNDGTVGPCIGSTIAWWPGEGNAKDKLAGFDLMMGGAGVPSWPAGKVGNSFDFNGEYFNTGLGNLSGLTQMTIEFWIRFAGAPATLQTVVMYSGTADVKIWSIDIQAGSKDLVFNFGAGIATAPLVANAFTHVAFLFDKGKISPYVNGVLNTNGIGMTNNSMSITPGGAKLTIGASSTNQSLFLGQLDEIAIYGTVLSQSDLTAIAGSSTSVCRQK